MSSLILPRRFSDFSAPFRGAWLCDDGRPSFGEAVAAAASMVVVFGLGYGATNWISQHRAAIEAWHGAWEREIPFCWWMIAPYVSLNALFALAPFFCASRAELGLLVRRVTAAIAIAAGIFLLLPSHFSLPRPTPASPVEAAFHWLIELDEPYNVFPSLHVTLVVLLSRVYRRSCRGAFSKCVRAWFILIGVSTIFTYQHHLLDFTAGLMLGLFCRSVVTAERRLSLDGLRGRLARLRTAYRLRAANAAAHGPVPESSGI